MQDNLIVTSQGDLGQRLVLIGHLKVTGTSHSWKTWWTYLSSPGELLSSPWNPRRWQGRDWPSPSHQDRVSSWSHCSPGRMRLWVWLCLRICLSHQLLGFLTGWARCYQNQLWLKCRLLGNTPSRYLMISFYSPGWFQIKDPPDSASWILGLQVHNCHEKCIFPKLLRHFWCPIVWEPSPRPVCMAIPNVFSWGTWQLWDFNLSGGKSQAF